MKSLRNRNRNRNTLVISLGLIVMFVVDDRTIVSTYFVFSNMPLVYVQLHCIQTYGGGCGASRKDQEY